MTKPPPHMSIEEFRDNGHRVVDWIADYLEKIESFPVLSQVKHGDIRAQLPSDPPLMGESFENIIADINDIVLPGITHWQSPNFFAYFPANSSGPSVLGDFLSSGLGVQGMMWATSPACTEIETHVLDWVVDMLSLPKHFKSTSTGGGVIQDSASSATLCALLAARERATGFQSNKDGVQVPLVAYASDEAHSSLEKAIKIAGIGSNHLSHIAVDDNFALNPESLKAQINSDLRLGRKPFFVLATLGTTSSTAIDPLEAISKICEDYGLWLHVDAASVGSAAICPEFRDMHKGINKTDSYCFNPHKWLLTNFDCDCFFVADRNELTKTLGILPEYLKNPQHVSDSIIDYRDWQIPLGRRFRALKLWFVIRHYGVNGLRQHIRYHVGLARHFSQWIIESNDFELAAPAPLNLVCFRHKGGEATNQELLNQLNQSGKIYLTHTRLDGQLTLRMAIGGTLTQLAHVKKAWKLIRSLSQGIITKHA